MPVHVLNHDVTMVAEIIMNVLCFNKTASPVSLTPAPLDFSKIQTAPPDLHVWVQLLPFVCVPVKDSWPCLCGSEHCQPWLEVLLWFLFGRETIRRGFESRHSSRHRFLSSNHFLLLRKWLHTNYWAMFATISEPFFSLFPWQQHDMPTACKRGRETNPVSFTAPKCLLSSVCLFNLPGNQKEKQQNVTSFPTFLLSFQQLIRGMHILLKTNEIVHEPELLYSAGISRVLHLGDVEVHLKYWFHFAVGSSPLQ